MTKDGVFGILCTGHFTSELLCLIYKPNTRRNAECLIFFVPRSFFNFFGDITHFCVMPIPRNNTRWTLSISFRHLARPYLLQSALYLFGHEVTS